MRFQICNHSFKTFALTNHKCPRFSSFGDLCRLLTQSMGDHVLKLLHVKCICFQPLMGGPCLLLTLVTNTNWWWVGLSVCIHCLSDVTSLFYAWFVSFIQKNNWIKAGEMVSMSSPAEDRWIWLKFIWTAFLSFSKTMNRYMRRYMH